MADVNLIPAHSRLALPGYAQARYVFCDGAKHDCTVLVNERGEIVAPSRSTLAAHEYNLETMRGSQPSSFGVRPDAAEGESESRQSTSSASAARA